MKAQKTILSIITIFTILFTNNILANTNSKIDNTKKSNSITLYQDSSSKKLILKTNKIDYRVEIYNEEGYIIKEFKLTKNTTVEVSTKDVKPGNYFIRYISNNPKNNSAEKLIIK